MGNKDMSGLPHDIKSDGEMWWYELGAGIRILCNRNEGEENNPIVSGIISWREIRNALKRKDKKKP